MAALTIRDQILEALQAKIAGIVYGQPLTDPYTHTWDKVTREPVRAGGLKSSVEVIEGPETKIPNIQHMICSLTVLLNFRAVIPLTENPAQAWNRLLGDLQRRVREDIYLGGLSLNVVEQSNEQTLEDETDRQIEGVLVLLIQYRHNINDPRKLV